MGKGLLWIVAALAWVAAGAWADSGVRVRVGIYELIPLATVEELAGKSIARDGLDGMEGGLFVELLEEIAEDENWVLAFAPGSYAEGQDRLKAGEIDLLVAVPFSPALAQECDFTHQAIISTWGQIYAAEGAEIQSMLDLKSRSVGVVRDDPALAEIQGFITRLGVDCTFVEFGNYADVCAAIEKGWVDAGLVDRIYGSLHARHYRVASTPIICSPVDFRYAAAKGKHGGLLKAIDYHLKSLKDAPHSRYYQLLNLIFQTQEEQRWTRLLLWGLGVLSGLLLLAGAGALFLRNQVRTKTAELWHKNAALEREIAERVQTQEELRQIEARLRQAQKMEAIGTLAGGIAHDFNNILQPIIGYSELMQEALARGQREGLADSLKAVMRAAQRAKGLVSQILSFSRHQEAEKQLLHLGPMIKETVKLLRATLPADLRISLSLNAAEDKVLADPTHVQQVLMNLCTNAAQAMHQQGGTLAVSLEVPAGPLQGWSTKVELGEGSFARIAVSDTGQGIAPAVLERIFDPFFTTKEPGKGTGLGLSVVHGILKNYGGAISVETCLGKGTTFHVYWPLSAEQGRSQKGLTEALLIGGGRERVLVVDDEATIAELFRDTLENLGYQVCSCTSSAEALELYQAEPGAFDLALIDQSMPGMTGEQLAWTMLGRRPEFPIILCTGFSEKVSPEKARALGIREFLLKPISTRQLAAALRRALDGQQGQGRLGNGGVGTTEVQG
jgi:signal transduction histidine kinase/ActR/RegA family two-component response regulator